MQRCNGPRLQQAGGRNRCRMPLFFNPSYNISLFGVEKLHAFDSTKWGKVFQALALKFPHLKTPLGPAGPVSEADLATIHSPAYLSSLESSATIASIAEVPPAACLPAWVLKRKVLEPFKFQTQGSVEAALHAFSHGFAVNVGGGFHHASRNRGWGFCYYADITLALKACRAKAAAVNPSRKPRFLILDLDAHQGDGHELDEADNADVSIVDCFTPGIFPNDRQAMRRIDVPMHFRNSDDGAAFLAELRLKLAAELERFKPDLIVYNAGTDILEGDPLSGLSITRESVIKRDELVLELAGYPRVAAATGAGAAAAVGGEVGFPAAAAGAGSARRPFIPVVYLLSGGYQKKTAAVISDSLINLGTTFGVFDKEWKPPSGPLPYAGAEAATSASAVAAAPTRKAKV